MTEQELLEWGRKEDETRKTELATVKSQADLTRVQAAAKKRRRAAGLSASDAVYAVKLAQLDAQGHQMPVWGGVVARDEEHRFAVQCDGCERSLKNGDSNWFDSEHDLAAEADFQDWQLGSRAICAPTAGPRKPTTRASSPAPRRTTTMSRREPEQERHLYEVTTRFGVVPLEARDIESARETARIAFGVTDERVRLAEHQGEGHRHAS